MSETGQPATKSRSFRPVAELLQALRFLTRLPIPFARTVDPVSLAQAMRFFAIAGALIGAFQGLVLVGLRYLHLPPLIAVSVTIAIGLLITGALHEDGFADTADGLFGGQTRDRRLEIMRDSRIGTFGACALILAIMIKAGAYFALMNLTWWHVILVTAGCAAFSRAMMVDLLWATKPARIDGLSALAGRPSQEANAFSIISGAAIAVAAAIGVTPDFGVIALGLALATTIILRSSATRLIGGQTGDICGAAQVLAELGMLTAFSASIR